MRFHSTRLRDVRLVECERVVDDRGYFARTFCAREFAVAGLATAFVQHSVSYSKQPGTVRGMHFQRAPHQEVKLLRCVSGAIFDVLIDLRHDSPSFLTWESYELSAGDGLQLYVPAGFAHGFQTLASDTAIAYMMTSFYAPEAADGVRYNDPLFGIQWPMPVTQISQRDLLWPDFASVPRPAG